MRGGLFVSWGDHPPENKLFTPVILREEAFRLMAEHLETFTIDARRSEVRDLCIKYLTGFKYKLMREEDQSLLFEKGSKRKNVYTFSFEEAYKRIKLSVVGSDKVPVTTVHVLFTLPFLRMRNDEIEGIRSMTKALHEFILITVGYQAT
ncbi:MAG: hypothetical protein ACRD6W_18160 [Nitrososphaerales archaeon]